MNGSVLLASAASETEVRKQLEEDIYAKEGVWDLEKVQIIPVSFIFQFLLFSTCVLGGRKLGLRKGRYGIDEVGSWDGWTEQLDAGEYLLWPLFTDYGGSLRRRFGRLFDRLDWESLWW